MRKLRLVSEELSEAVGGWTKDSEHLYVHASGARIERRGYPEQHGWYLVPAVDGEPVRRFAPTVQGCDAALVAFASHRAVTAYLSHILGMDDERRAS